uniref:Cytochrome b6/f subunit IV n=1 Tax=Gaultheria fragrantissima TaxID=586110 RepID=A0A8A4YMB9_9ERIC|nr:cytochrome b6/f complex subunit IV [Agapetes malipoensis]YP_010238563.1 cytochrome b6/f subunit IV [Gaultheria fragrantissima]QTE20619.1 cytochrome b6/f subunit IV [Gaultheria fragrantissima]UAX04319.1 cytochrome b6/f complex subunit IV [Agapetes malipoensis]UGO88488.1 cytochrome b6/f subunit IV [Gaultheria nummularioides]
MGVSDLND